MPHIVIEYSNNLKTQVTSTNITEKLHQTVIASELFNPDAVKARSIGFDDFVLNNDIDSFIHVTISILNGRSQEERKTLSQSAFSAIQKLIPEAEKISVNIHEMNGDTYSK